MQNMTSLLISSLFILSLSGKTKISINDSLKEAAALLKSSETEALYVIQRLGLMGERVVGVLTKELIEAQYQLSYN